MAKLKSLAFILIPIFAFIILLAVSQSDPHDFTGKCNLCHVGLKDTSVLTHSPDRQCLQCHPDNSTRSHPSNIIPKQKLPVQYPLFKGKMVCISCHFPHKKMRDSESDDIVEIRGPQFLRAERAGRSFCFSCHKAGFSAEKIDSHAISIKMAHLKTKNIKLQGLVDDNSRECLSCHDGTLSSNVSTQIKNSGVSWEHNKNIGLSHPIGIDYQQAYLKKPRFFHPVSSLNPKINLINGKLGCETCHDHYSKIKNRLVMDNFRSRLCLSCHNL